MRTIAKLIFATIFFLSPAIRAQQPLAGTDLRLSPQVSAPSNLSGRAGIYNKSGVFTWHTAANADLPALACASCTNNRILYFNSGTGQAGTALIVGGNSDSLYDTSGLYGVRFTTSYVMGGYNTQNQASAWGWRSKSNLIEAVTNGNVIFNDNGSVAQFLHEVEVSGGAVVVDPATLVDGATININCATTDTFVVTIAASRTFTVSGVSAGTTFMLQVIQGGTGSNTATWPATFHWPGGTAPTLTTTVGQADVVSCKSFSGSALMCVANTNFAP